MMAILALLLLLLLHALDESDDNEAAFVRHFFLFAIEGVPKHSSLRTCSHPRQHFEDAFEVAWNLSSGRWINDRWGEGGY